MESINISSFMECKNNIFSYFLFVLTGLWLLCTFAFRPIWAHKHLLNLCSGRATARAPSWRRSASRTRLRRGSLSSGCRSSHSTSSRCRCSTRRASGPPPPSSSWRMKEVMNREWGRQSFLSLDWAAKTQSAFLFFLPLAAAPSGLFRKRWNSNLHWNIRRQIL